MSLIQLILNCIVSLLMLRRLTVLKHLIIMSNMYSKKNWEEKVVGGEKKAEREID